MHVKYILKAALNLMDAGCGVPMQAVRQAKTGLKQGHDCPKGMAMETGSGRESPYSSSIRARDFRASGIGVIA